MSVAIYLNTESGDEYLYCLPRLSISGIVEILQKEMSTELGYVSTLIVTVMRTQESFAESDKSYEDKLYSALSVAVDEMGED